MDSQSSASSKDQREFARIPVSCQARICPVDEEGADVIGAELAVRPSVWGPSNEISMGDLVTSGSSNHEAMLAQAILELSSQIVQLRSEVFDRLDGMVPVEIVELSGGGGRFVTGMELKVDDLVELRFAPGDDIPPVRSVVRIRHRYDDPDRSYGFGYERIHRLDRDRLIRTIYQLQRRAIRDAQLEKAGR